MYSMCKFKGKNINNTSKLSCMHHSCQLYKEINVKKQLFVFQLFFKINIAVENHDCKQNVGQSYVAIQFNFKLMLQNKQM